MSSANVTITAPFGPGDAAVATVINGVRDIKFDIEQDVIFITESDGKIRQFQYNTIATITYTISSGVGTITIST